VGKKEANNRVERSLYQKANGYSYDAVKIFMPAGAKKPIYAPYVEHVPPSDASVRNHKEGERSMTPGVDRDGKPCGPTLLACSCCGCGKGEEHTRSCYVWSSRYGRRIHCWNAACVVLERALAAQSYGTSPLLRNQGGAGPFDPRQSAGVGPQVGKKEANNRVERSLYQKANGYSYDAVKIFMPAGAKKPIYAPYVEHVPPSDVAAIFWMKNRDPANWRDAWQVEHTLGKYSSATGL
jgi:hypothetical protein